MPFLYFGKCAYFYLAVPLDISMHEGSKLTGCEFHY